MTANGDSCVRDHVRLVIRMDGHSYVMDGDGWLLLLLLLVDIDPLECRRGGSPLKSGIAPRRRSASTIKELCVEVAAHETESHLVLLSMQRQQQRRRRRPTAKSGSCGGSNPGRRFIHAIVFLFVLFLHLITISLVVPEVEEAELTL